MVGALDAATLRDAMSRYLVSLEEHREEIDSLNVFPVPDGDTGTNMLLTQRAVVEACGGLDGADLPELGEAVSRAALMGARGNSGVILSQILRGFCARYCVSSSGAPDGNDLAQALGRAEEEARSAVGKPLEGTILSVMRDAAEAAAKSAGDDEAQPRVAAAALEAAKASLERTPEQLPELARAGVVDAGGKGLVLLLDAIASSLLGTGSTVEVGPMGPVGATSEMPRLGEVRYGYEVMYLYEGPDADVPHLKRSLGELGDSLVVVGGGGLYNIHVHTDDPGAAVEAAIRAGRPRSIRITSLDAQVAEHCVAADGFREVGVSDQPARPAKGEPALGETIGDQSLVAVVEGPGLEEIFRSLGAVVVRGGPGHLPSVRELVDAIDRAPADLVHVLPNHPNVIPAAEAAAKESAKTVNVTHATTVPKGLAAALCMGDRDFDSVGAGMLAAAYETCSGEIAYAEKQAEWRGGRVDVGDCLGLSGGDILVVGSDPAEVAVTLARKLGVAVDAEARNGPDAATTCNELLTLYVGADATDEEAERVAAALRDAFPDLEVEVQRGGQPRYPYLIGIE